MTTARSEEGEWEKRRRGEGKNFFLVNNLECFNPRFKIINKVIISPLSSSPLLLFLD